MSNGFAVEAIVAQIRRRIAQENASKSGAPEAGLSANEGPAWDVLRCRQRIDEDSARFADLDLQLEYAARNIGQQPFAPPTWRGRIGAWIVQGLRRLLWWYGLPIKESIAQIGLRNREHAIRHRYLREDLLALSESLQKVVGRIDGLQQAHREAQSLLPGIEDCRTQIRLSIEQSESRFYDLQESQHNAAETAARRLQEMEEDWSRRHDEVADRIPALNDRIQGLSAAYAVSEALRTNLASRVADLETRLAAEATAREALAGRIEGDAGRIHRLDRAVASLGERIADAIGRTEPLEYAVGAVNAQLQAEAKAREALAGVVNAQAGQLKQVVGAAEPLASLPDRVSSLEAMNQQHAASIRQFDEALGGLEGRIADAIDTARRLADTAHALRSHASGEDLRLLTVREVTGRIEAVLSWVPDPALRRDAEGTLLHLSSHVLDPSDGRVILFDGPRAVPCRGPEGRLSVLPLAIPRAPGRYRVHIEPVAEQRFWASDRGYRPLVLDAERRPDGSLVFYSAATDRQYALNRQGAQAFSLDSPLYGLDDSERCIEIPWVLAQFHGEARVLDIGYANAEARYVEARDALQIPFLVGLDLVGLDMAAAPQSGISGVAGDARALPFRPGAFDLIFAISVIEHIGRDNSKYGVSEEPMQEFGDLDAVSGLATLLRPGGRLLVTVPFGRLQDHGWFVQYDLHRIEVLVERSGCELTLAEYYAYSAHGWTGPVDPATLSQVEYRTGFAAGAVACLALTRRGDTAS